MVPRIVAIIDAAPNASVVTAAPMLSVVTVAFRLLKVVAVLVRSPPLTARAAVMVTLPVLAMLARSAPLVKNVIGSVVESVPIARPSDPWTKDFFGPVLNVSPAALE